MELARRLVESRRFQLLIIGVILLNAAVLGLLTLHGLSPQMRQLLVVLDQLCLAIFCIELGLKIGVWRLGFFREGWNIFDLLVVGVALLPTTGPLAVLRALRVLRVLRLATAVPSMRRVVTGMFVAIPGGASVAGVLLVLYYVGAVIGNNLFAARAPQYFGDFATTFFTLFKLMTLEGWPDIADEVMVAYPHAWIFFVTFIIFTAFTTLNLLFGIIVDAMETAKEQEAHEVLAEQGLAVEAEPSELRLARMEEELRAMHLLLANLAGVPAPPSTEPPPPPPDASTPMF